MARLKHKPLFNTDGTPLSGDPLLPRGLRSRHDRAGRACPMSSVAIDVPSYRYTCYYRPNHASTSAAAWATMSGPPSG